MQSTSEFEGILDQDRDQDLGIRPRGGRVRRTRSRRRRGRAWRSRANRGPLGIYHLGVRAGECRDGELEPAVECGEGEGLLGVFRSIRCSLPCLDMQGGDTTRFGGFDLARPGEPDD